PGRSGGALPGRSAGALPVLAGAVGLAAALALLTSRRTGIAAARRPRNVVFLGATKGMGRALARHLAVDGARFALLGRSLDDLARTAADLTVRAGGAAALDALPDSAPSPHADASSARADDAAMDGLDDDARIIADHLVVRCDLADPTTFAPALDAAAAFFDGPIDAVVVTAGVFATQEALEADLDRLGRLLTIDFTNTILFCEHAKRHLLKADGGRSALCVFSSVAGERGRKPVALYGAAKAGLSRYLEALDHRHHGDGLRVLCVKPGFVRTGMTAGLPAPPFAGEPEAVAAQVVRALERGAPEIYAPAIWRWVMLVIRQLPRAVMRRVGF
ncbi:MAG: SDR family NAD(P)-dependent oxidoreductase, partial [Acidobacteriota bacterium]